MKPRNEAKWSSPPSESYLEGSPSTKEALLEKKAIHRS